MNMNKISVLLLAGAVSGTMMAQDPTDAYRLSTTELNGTARFMSMGGAFGALGGDLSTLSQNPGGIGVYRSNEVGFTISLDMQHNTSTYANTSYSLNHTTFSFNNVGVVGTLRLRNKVMPNLNLGFTYNKAASFNRRYRGSVPQLKTSLSNYIAGIANNYNLTEPDVKTTDTYDPYTPGVNDRYVPWAPVLGYDSFLITPEEQHDGTTHWYGQFGDGTTGTGFFDVQESGSIDEYNIALGGNIANKVFWGMNFGIVDVDYTVSSIWQESLQKAYVYNPNYGRIGQQNADWIMDQLYNLTGSGFNYQLGVIVKPIQELRLGLAFHTPTYYNLTENYAPDQVDYTYNFKHNPALSEKDNYDGNDYAETNGGVSTYDKVRLQTPWRVIASVAGVIGSKCIVSFDYEWQGYKKMKFKEPNYYNYYNDYYDDYYGYDYYYGNLQSEAPYVAQPTPIQMANDAVRTIYRNSSTIRIGAEYRVLPQLSVRAGFNYNWSPVTSEAKSNLANIPSSGTFSYTLDNQTMYVTAGVGYRIKSFYVDAAYVYKHTSSTYTPFAADPYDMAATAMNAKLGLNNHKVVLSAGFKF
ncbi:MAG: outer membrane protein transport protein [Bacteroidales bacterium]|nr:outer membrane protein transport protein [Bacteroidales bacterium]